MFWLVSLFLGLVVFILSIEYVLPYIIKKAMIMALKRKCTGKLILTYDDGPGPALESDILKVLNKHGVRATFFLNGMRAELFPGQCDLLMERGQELGFHCHTHYNAYKTTPWVVLADIRKAYRVLEKWVERDRIFRPPHGKLTLSLGLYLMRKGVKIIFWTVDSGDTHLTLPQPESIVEKVIRENGAVVLMHSFDREPPETAVRSEYVLCLTQSLLKAAKEHGLKICTFRELNHAGS